MSYGPLGHILERRCCFGDWWWWVKADNYIIASKSDRVGEVVTACQIKAPMGLLFSIPITWRSSLLGGNQAARKILLQTITAG